MPFDTPQPERVGILIPFPQNNATIFRELKDDYMKVNYPQRIDATARELKII